jgi:hypothetical protein
MRKGGMHYVCAYMYIMYININTQAPTPRHTYTHLNEPEEINEFVDIPALGVIAPAGVGTASSQDHGSEAWACGGGANSRVLTDR